MRSTPALNPTDGAGGSHGRTEGTAHSETDDTERPPPFVGSVGLDVFAQAQVGESTRVGPPPDPGEAGTGGYGPPTPRGLRAAPLSRPALPQASGARLAAAPPLGPSPDSPSAPSHAEGTRIGLAPPQQPESPRAERARTPASAVEERLTRRCASCGEHYPADFLVCPRDATPLAAAPGADADPLVGSLIGDTYQIVRVIGEGGMGRVYEARHLRLRERRFAVKCLHAGLARNAEMAARFLREAESASSIRHDNVVDVFDVHHLSDGTPYLVGEFLEGEELAEYVTKRGPLEPRTAAKVARQVCGALSAAHERGIVHRDMKPENIFVLGTSIAAVERGESRKLHIKVLDFGISKAGPGDQSNLTRTGVIMGTPSYMAPEQARGREVDHRADIYAVGACLYFMVTGRRPFDAEDVSSTLSMVLTEDPVRPRDIDTNIPELLELIIQRAMAKDPHDRYGSMDVLEKALATFTGNSSLMVPSTQMAAALEVRVPQLHAGGAQRAFDVAKAMLGTGSLPEPSQQSGNLARTARPTIVVTSAVLGAWFVGGTVAALAGLVRVLHDGEVTITESLLLVVGCLFAAATPAALYVMHLRRVVWPNSVRALQLATDLKRTTISALVTYGGFSILGRVVHTVFWRSSHGLASGVWDIALFLLSVAAASTIGGLGPLLRNLRRRRRDVT